MDGDQKRKVQKWLKVMKEYIDPVQLMDRFPNRFPLNSTPRNRVMEKYEQPHEAVEIVIGELLQCHTEENLYQRFVGAVRDTGHSWLSELITGETYGIEAEVISQVETAEYVNQFFTLILPHINEIIKPQDVAYHLKVKHVFTAEDHAQVEARIQMRGEHAAVRHLLAILVRKPPGWWREFIKIMEDLNYEPTLINSLHTIQNDISSSSSSASYESHHEVTVNHQEGATNMAAGAFTASHSHTPLHEDIWCHATGRKNVMVILPFECGKAWTIAHLAQLNGKFTSSKVKVVGFLVSTNDKAKVCLKEIQALLTTDDLPVTCLTGGSGKQLNDVIESSGIVVMTPQKMLNALEKESKSLLFKFDMLIFDDCESAMQGKPCDQILRQYFRLEDSGTFTRPQIVGFSTVATMQLKNVGGDNVSEDLLSLCAKYDTVFGGLMTIPLGYEDEIFRPLDVVLGMDTTDGYISDPISQSISEAMDKTVELLHSLDVKKIDKFSYLKSLSKGTKQYTRWCCYILTEAAIEMQKEDEKVFMEIQKCVSILLKFNRAIKLKFIGRGIDAMKHLVPCVENMSNTDGLEAHLYGIVKRSIEDIKQSLEDPRCVNQALHEMKEKLRVTFSKVTNSKVLIVVPHSYYVKPIQAWLVDLANDDLCRWDTGAILGVEDEKGTMAGLRSCISEVKNFLKGAQASVVVCALEIATGIPCHDILVIHYDCFDSKPSSSDSIMICSDQIELKDNARISMPLKVETAIQKFKDECEKDRYDQEIKKRQVLPPEPVEDSRERVVPNGDRNEAENPGVGKVVCRGKIGKENCNSFACYTSDIEVLLTNYTCTTDVFKDKYITKRVEDGGTEKKEGLFCRKCNSKWGIFTTYKALVIPQLKPNAFYFYKNGDENCAPIHGKKWESITIGIDFKKVSYDEMSAKLLKSK